jgi:hypothetical protein
MILSKRTTTGLWRNDMEVDTALEGAASLITEADLVNPRKVSRL